MSFTRTKSGLANYAIFYGANVMIFVEGKKQPDSDIGNAQTVQTADELFHHAILSQYSPNKIFKVKSVGSKTNLDSYAKNIISGKVPNCLLIYDSDYEVITSSWMSPRWTMRTAGYSWENDLWTKEVCSRVITTVSGGRSWDKVAFDKKFEMAKRRLERLSRIEVYCRIYGMNLILPRAKSIGIKLDCQSPSLISSDEVSRLMRRVCDKLRSIRDLRLDADIKRTLTTFSYCNLVRGHIWDAACITLIVGTLRSVGCFQSSAIDNIRNIALGIFSQDPDACLTPIAREHYKAQQLRAGLS